ncbi:MAG: RluA family pseudouridine synthase [Ignavibacteria bacterium]|nr:RluA family pseudouridine synthase [Ignavibacteria bacterium]
MKKVHFDTIFEDDDIIVIDKPSGLLSLPDRYDRTLPNVREILLNKYGSIFVVHRLDRDTSGVMVLCKTADAHRILSEQFGQHTVEKLYHAIVSGVVDRDQFTIDIPLASDSKRKGLMKPSARGKESHTEIVVLERFRLASLIQCTLITGRTHQIRVHCSAIGHPLLVDPDYGTSAEFKLSAIKRRYKLAKNTIERPIIDRVTLHAFRISFRHPSTNQEISFTADYPRDFTAALQILKKYSAPYTSAIGDYF